MISFKLHPLTIIIGLILWLYPCLISEDIASVGEPEAGPSALEYEHSGKKLPQKKLLAGENQQFDSKAFLLSFKRQADEELYLCLQQEFGLSGRVFLTANLEKAGKLLDTRLLGGTLPACFLSALEEMSFANLTSEMTSPSVVIQWQVEW